jgi:hypothetical protein
MDGTNGGTLFPDTSSYALTSSTSPFGATHLQPIFSAITSTVEFEYGTAAYNGGPAGASGILRVINNNTITQLESRFEITAGMDFTIEASFWKATPSAIESPTIFELSGRGADQNRQYLWLASTIVSGVPVFIANEADGTTNVVHLTGSTNLCDGAWHKIAVTRAGNAYRLYIDGVLEASATSSGVVGGTVANHLGLISMGGSEAGAFSNLLRDGYIDEVRFTNGVARYTGSTYTPDTAAFPDVICGTTPDISVDPSSLDFGDENLHIPSAAMDITVTNTGDALSTLHVTAAISGADAAMFSETDDLAGGIPAGESRTIHVVFTPSAIGAKTASLDLTTDAVSQPMIPLAGNGADPGLVYLEGRFVPSLVF